jgi:hypothetical protein
MYESYQGLIIEYYASDCEEDTGIYYWAVFAGETYLGDHFTSIFAARFAAYQYIELARLYDDSGSIYNCGSV